MTLALRNARLTCVSESRFVLPSSIQLIRHCSSNQNSSSKSNSLTRITPQSVRKNVKGYMFSRLFDYVKNYNQVLEKNFPSAVRVYRVYFDGVKDFFADMKRYVKIARIANDAERGPRKLNRQELELYMQLPKDMVKLGPTIVLSSLPVVGYAVFPVAFMYPKTFLSSHFWTLQQKSEFQQKALAERLSNNRPVLRCLQSMCEKADKTENNEKLKTILGLIGSGFHPSVEQILDAKNVFSKPPFVFPSLNSKHIKLLTRLHGIPGAFFRYNRIAEHAFLLHYMDLAMMREGGIHNMPQESIRHACYLRGLNPSNLSSDEMIQWLRNWVKISTSIREQHMSLFLHLPIFLGYNHPNNWQLIYGKH